MSVILGTTPPKPASPAINATGYRPAPIDSRTKPEAALLAASRTAHSPAFNVAPALPTDVNTLRKLQQDIEARTLAAEVHATGIAAGFTIDDLQRLGAVRLRELKANALERAEWNRYDLNAINAQQPGGTKPPAADPRDEFAGYDLNGFLS